MRRCMQGETVWRALSRTAWIGVMVLMAPSLAGAQTTGTIAPTQDSLTQDSLSQEPSAQESRVADPDLIHQEAVDLEWDGRYDEARQLHQQAAALGHGPSLYQLGFLMLDGLGGPRDVEAARQSLRAAADAGVTLALVPYIYSYDDQDDPDQVPDAFIAARALLELSLRDLAMAGDTIQFWSPPMRRQVQVYLKEAGFYRGAIDGLIGQGSLNALRNFARRRAALPDLPVRRFERLVLSENGVRSDARPLFAWQDIDTVIAARSAFAGAALDEGPEGTWHIGVDDAALLDWPGPADPSKDDRRVAFHLPGTPHGEALRFGLDRRRLAARDLGVCARVDPDDETQSLRRCETRVAGVHLVFRIDTLTQPAFGPAAHAAPPSIDRLAAIELSPPLELRLSGSSGP